MKMSFGRLAHVGSLHVKALELHRCTSIAYSSTMIPTRAEVSSLQNATRKRELASWMQALACCSDDCKCLKLVLCNFWLRSSTAQQFDRDYYFATL